MFNIFRRKSKVYPVLEFKWENDKTLPYVFKKSKNRQAPLLIILHGNGSNREAAKFITNRYNILCPLDRYGFKGNGCWFLGEGGDFFYARMLEALVERIIEEHNLNREIYIWGSSMGGTGAILHGFFLRAHAVFSHIPQINMHDSHWYGKNIPHIDHIFKPGDKTHPYRDLTSFITVPHAYFPLLFLSFNRFDRPFYNQEHMTPLLAALDKLHKNYFLIVHPQSGHNLNQTIAEQTRYFDLYDIEIQANFAEQNLSAKCARPAPGKNYLI